MKALRDMTDPELTEFFVDLARVIEDRLPPGPSAKGKCLFALVVAEDRSGPGMFGQYVSNAERKGVIKMLREVADRMERREDFPREETPGRAG